MIWCSEKMTMYLLFIVYLIKRKPNIQIEYYKTQQSECETLSIIMHIYEFWKKGQTFGTSVSRLTKKCVLNIDSSWD